MLIDNDLLNYWILNAHLFVQRRLFLLVSKQNLNLIQADSFLSHFLVMLAFYEVVLHVPF